MTKEEFLQLQREDIKSLNDPTYETILKLFSEYIPSSADIKENKSVVGMYYYMKDYASKNQKGNFFCIASIDIFKKLMFEYLEITEERPKNKFSLEDFFL